MPELPGVQPPLTFAQTAHIHALEVFSPHSLCGQGAQAPFQPGVNLLLDH